MAKCYGCLSVNENDDMFAETTQLSPFDNREEACVYAQAMISNIAQTIFNEDWVSHSDKEWTIYNDGGRIETDNISVKCQIIDMEIPDFLLNRGNRPPISAVAILKNSSDNLVSADTTALFVPYEVTGKNELISQIKSLAEQTFGSDFEQEENAKWHISDDKTFGYVQDTIFQLVHVEIPTSISNLFS